MESALKTDELKTDVLIVGAGPTGLSLACQLARFGIYCVVVEKKEGVTPFSKAIGVQARTLEIYEQLGLAERAIERGTIGRAMRFLVNGEIRGELDLSTIGQGESAYPFILMLEQSKNEQLLYEYLREHGRDVLWSSELQNFTQDDASVTAHMQSADGSQQIIEAKYLVGCDGPKSPVRHSLGLTFEGSTFERIFYVADVQIDWALSHDCMHLVLAKDTFLLFFPLKGEKRYRIVGVFPEEYAKDQSDILYDEIENRVKQECEIALDIHDVEWFSTYKVHTRHVNQFSSGCCFLAGDAAHIHSPAGAQGMNTGIQDAYNLAWKLAAVMRHSADEKLLATYNEERLENAKHLLQTTDRAFQLGAGDQWFLAFIRLHVFPAVADTLLHLEPVKHFVFPLISQIGINYRHSSLANHTDDEHFKIKAGDRMPYFTVNGASIYNLLRAPKFHLLAFSDNFTESDGLRDAVSGQYSEFVDFHAVPLSGEAAKLFNTDEPFAILLRPDNYIARIIPDIGSYGLANYLSTQR